MISPKKAKLLEIAKRENAICTEMAMEIYEQRSSASRALSEMTDDGLLNKREAPNLSKSKYIWTLTEKSENLLE